VSLLLAILILVLLGLVVMVVTAPLRERQALDSGASEQSRLASSASSAVAAGETIAREDLEAAREAKYGEIRDSELDFRTGKLSAEDFAAIDAQLRAEAIAILDRLERLRPRDS
jgi:Tfp pilus assembly protein PilX